MLSSCESTARCGSQQSNFSSLRPVTKLTSGSGAAKTKHHLTRIQDRILVNEGHVGPLSRGGRWSHERPSKPGTSERHKLLRQAFIDAIANRAITRTGSWSMSLNPAVPTRVQARSMRIPSRIPGWFGIIDLQCGCSAWLPPSLGHHNPARFVQRISRARPPSHSIMHWSPSLSRCPRGNSFIALTWAHSPASSGVIFGT